MTIREDQINLVGNYLHYGDFVHWLKLQLQDGVWFYTRDFPEILNEHKFHFAVKHGKVPCCVFDITREQLIPYFKRAEKEGVYKVVKYHKHNKELPVIITSP